MKLDILAFGAHPDDVEMGACGLLLVEIARGKKVGIIDLTQGELGTRGSKHLRKKEATLASERMGLHARHNLHLKDGYIQNDASSQHKVIQYIRHYCPSVVLANAIEDRHPDHGRGAKLVRDAFFLSGLRKVKTQFQGVKQETHRPFHLIHYIQDMQLIPNFYLDISEVWEQKQSVIQAYESQFFSASSTSNEPETYISTKRFAEAFEARHINFGKQVGVHYAESFQHVKPLGMRDLDFLLHVPF